MSTTNTNKSTNKPKINTSSIETQQQLRTAKMDKLRQLGFDPYPVDSQKDFDIGFVKFWFDIIHKFDLNLIASDETNFLLEHYFYQAMFPSTLLETFEEKIQMRHTVRQMGMDPDNDIDTEDTSFDEEIISQMRGLLPELKNKSKDQKEKLFYDLIVDKSELDSSGQTNLGEGIELILQPNQIVTLCGRIKTIRTSGKIAFAVLEDESCPEGIQVILKKDILNQSIDDRFGMIFSVDNIKEKLEIE